MIIILWHMARLCVVHTPCGSPSHRGGVKLKILPLIPRQALFTVRAILVELLDIASSLFCFDIFSPDLTKSHLRLPSSLEVRDEPTRVVVVIHGAVGETVWR